MGINSSMYLSDVVHIRTAPTFHKFKYKVFNFYLDLEEIPKLVSSSFFFSYNRFNLFSFYDKDHIQMGKSTCIENVKEFAKQSGVTQEIESVKLLTNLRVLGYVFNPVSFYFCFDRVGKLVCAIPEVGNTFGEIKPYLGLLNKNTKQTIADPDVYIREPKNFYVSPFIPLDSEFEFRLNVPEETLKIGVDSYESGERILTTSFIGKKKFFSTLNLVKLFAQFPLITVKVIALIHWQAMWLWLKKIPYIKKNNNLEKQTGVPLGQVSKPVSLARNN